MTIKGLRLPILGQPNPNEPKDVHLVGRYALGVTWGDNHSSIYPFDRLRRENVVVRIDFLKRCLDLLVQLLDPPIRLLIDVFGRSDVEIKPVLRDLRDQRRKLRRDLLHIAPLVRDALSQRKKYR